MNVCIHHPERAHRPPPSAPRARTPPTPHADLRFANEPLFTDLFERQKISYRIALCSVCSLNSWRLQYNTLIASSSTARLSL